MFGGIKNISMRKFMPLVLLLFLALQGCYFPILFDAEIRIDRVGYYSIIFDGYLADVNLYNDIREGKITAAEEKKKVAERMAYFKRDAAVTEIKYFKKGRFKVHWVAKGDLLKDKMVTFLRRNNKMITLKYVSTENKIVVEGASISKATAKRLTAMGLGGLRGKMRVITDAKVSSNNADRKRKGKNPREIVYSWKINGVKGPTPRLVIGIR